MAFQVEGKLHKIFDVEQKSERFQAREFVIETEEQYPQFIKFQLVQDKCELIDAHNEGEKINVHFDLRGREWNDKFFTNLNAWRVEAADGSAGGASPAPAASKPSTPAPASTAAAPAAPQADFDDDLSLIHI